MTGLLKTRLVAGSNWSSTSSSYGNASPGQHGQFVREAQAIQTENHPGYENSDGSRDTGGIFESWKISFPTVGIPWQSRYNFVERSPIPGAPTGWQYSTSTFLVASSNVAAEMNNVNASWKPDDALNLSYLSGKVNIGPTYSQLMAMGTKAVNLTKPDNPSVDLATSLAELWSERKFFSLPGRNGGVSGEYLNYQFGIAPTVADFQALRDAIENRDAILRQYQRDSGKIIRRQFRFDPEVTVVKTTANQPVFGMGHGLNSYQCPPGGRLTTTTTTRRKYWFAGAFRYSIPKDAFPARIQELDRLYGVKPGLSTGWELIPFSWLVDYFVPVGNILENMDSFLLDGLVMPYAYIMCTTEVDTEYDWFGSIYNSDGYRVNVGVKSVVRKTRLRRHYANPFGFGLLDSDLSPKQLSILAALGMSLRKK